MEAVGNLSRVEEMVVEGVYVFEDAAAGADGEVVDRDDVLGVFGEGDAADVLKRLEIRWMGLDAVADKCARQQTTRVDLVNSVFVGEKVGKISYRVKRDVDLCRHQHDSHDFIQSTESTSVRLDIIQRLGL